ncbi:MAG: spore coat protein CotJB [Oscillospiraceae bacterium]|nr:spore coat protein CotJB [Oscillospiraceae bacterium]
MNRSNLLRAIQMYDFYLYELQLYLDTHPRCQRALETYKQYKEMRQRAMDEFSARFGPITPYQADCDGVFSWAKAPWPWEKEGN